MNLQRQQDETAGSDIRQVLAKRSTFCKLQLAARGALSRRLAIQISLQVQALALAHSAVSAPNSLGQLTNHTLYNRTSQFTNNHTSSFQLPVRVIVVQWQCSVLLQLVAVPI